jgi:SsrA-binding protein
MPSYTKNKKAYHDYEILQDFEAGIVLNGDEVKSVKGNRANLKGGHIRIIQDEAFMFETHISPYPNSSRKEPNPTRNRKLLLHKKEIGKIDRALSEKGATCVPLEMYSKQGLIKIRIGICRGKKLHDKREVLKQRSQQRDIERQLKNY